MSCICENPPGSRPAGRPALADHARAEAERHALQTTIKSQTAELAQVRKARESLSADLTKLAAQFDAQQQVLADYRLRLSPAGTAG